MNTMQYHMLPMQKEATFHIQGGTLAVAEKLAVSSLLRISLAEPEF